LWEYGFIFFLAFSKEMDQIKFGIFIIFEIQISRKIGKKAQIIFRRIYQINMKIAFYPQFFGQRRTRVTGRFNLSGVN